MVNYKYDKFHYNKPILYTENSRYKGILLTPGLMLYNIGQHEIR